MAVLTPYTPLLTLPPPPPSLADATAGGVVTVATLDALRALGDIENLDPATLPLLVWVKNDVDGFMGSYWYNASIVEADDDGSGIIAFGNGLGGYERKGV